MKLRVPFSFLLAELLLVLIHVVATPAKRSPGLVTLPPKHSPWLADVHPAVVSNTQRLCELGKAFSLHMTTMDESTVVVKDGQGQEVFTRHPKDSNDVCTSESIR